MLDKICTVGHTYSGGYSSEALTLNVHSLGGGVSGTRQQLMQTAMRAARSVGNELYGSRDILGCMKLVLSSIDTTRYSSGTEVIDAVLDADTAKWFKAYRVTPALQALLPAGIDGGRCKAAVNAVYKLSGGTVAGSKGGAVQQRSDGQYTVEVTDLSVQLFDRGLTVSEIQSVLQWYGHELTEWELTKLLRNECGYLEKFIHTGSGEMVHCECTALTELEDWADVVVQSEQRKWRGM